MKTVLFSPLQLRDVRMRNRVAVSPMCQYSATDGVPTSWHLVHLGCRAVGGAGLVMAEATAVSEEGRISPGDSGLWNDTQGAAWAPIAAFIAAQGAVPGVQLGHAGRKASCDVPWRGGEPLAPASGAWQTVAPSAVPFAEGHPVPRALSLAEVQALPDAFAAAARRAVAAGFAAVEVHAAHGYLLHQFLSPLANHREDAYGGDFEGRIRLLVEVAEAIRATFPAGLPLLVRVSATDWAQGGWDLPQTVELARRLRDRGVDLVDCSAGGLVHSARMPTGPGFQVPFAAAVRREAGLPTGTVGFITQAYQAEQIVATGEADLVFLAREMLRDPYWALHAARELGVDVPWPDQYLRAKK
jgi:2,4-dienoyl-CoA reductase-like NADH-dependent reductase (Old Yellow Enzyme family)